MKVFTPRNWRITFRIDQTEGEILDLDMDTLLRMQTACEIAEARDREADIKVKRYTAKLLTAHERAML